MTSPYLLQKKEDNRFWLVTLVPLQEAFCIGLSNSFFCGVLGSLLQVQIDTLSEAITTICQNSKGILFVFYYMITLDHDVRWFKCIFHWAMVQVLNRLDMILLNIDPYSLCYVGTFTFPAYCSSFHPYISFFLHSSLCLKYFAFFWQQEADTPVCECQWMQCSKGLCGQRAHNETSLVSNMWAHRYLCLCH